MRQIDRRWLQANRLLLTVFLLLLTAVCILGSLVFFSQIPRIRVYLHIETKPTKQEQAVLTNLSKPLDQIGYNREFKSVKKLAKKAPILEVGRCNPEPTILHVKNATLQTFRNSDKKAHTLTFTNKKDLVLEPGTQKTLLIDFFDFSPGVFTYLCDNSERPTGAIYMTQE